MPSSGERRNPQRIIDEANEDLDQLCSVFAAAGVTVYRPDVPRTDLRHLYGGSG